MAKVPADPRVPAIEALPMPSYAMLGWVSYRGGMLSLAASPAGLSITVAPIFPFHPPILVPWSRISPSDTIGGGWGRRVFGGSIMLDGRVRLRTTLESTAAIERASAQHGAQTPFG